MIHKPVKFFVPLFGFVLGAVLGNVIITPAPIPPCESAAEWVGMVIATWFGLGFIPGVIGYCIGKKFVNTSDCERSSRTQPSSKGFSPVTMIVVAVLLCMIAYSAIVTAGS